VIQLLGQGFLDLARQGKNARWRYLLSLLAILIGFLASVVLLKVFLDIERVGSAIILWGYLLDSILLIASLFVAIRFIHCRPFLSLITPHRSFDWKRATVGFGFFLMMLTVASIIEAVIFPGRYQLTWNAKEFLKFLPIVLMLMPTWATMEELFFRGYLMQSIGLKTRRPVIPIVVSSLIFTFIHLLNPEVKANPILVPAYYFGTGLLFAFVTLRDNRLELAIGAHAGNNLFLGLFANYADSVVATPSIFTASKLDAQYALGSFAVIAILFYVGMFAPRQASSDNMAM